MRISPDGSARITRYKTGDEQTAEYRVFWAQRRAGLFQLPPEEVDAVNRGRCRKSEPPGGASRYLVVFEGVNGPARALRTFYADARALASRHPGARILPVAGLGPCRDREA